MSDKDNEICKGLTQSDYLYTVCRCPDGLKIEDPLYSACNCARGVRSLQEQTDIYNRANIEHQQRLARRNQYVADRNRWDELKLNQETNLRQFRPIGRKKTYWHWGGQIVSDQCGGCDGNTFGSETIGTNAGSYTMDESVFNDYSKRGGLDYDSKVIENIDWLGWGTCKPVCKFSERSVEELMREWVRQNPVPPFVDEVKDSPTPPTGNQAIACCSNYMNISNANQIQDVQQNCNQSIVQTIINSPPKTSPPPSESPPTTSPPPSESPPKPPIDPNISKLSINQIIAISVAVSVFVLFSMVIGLLKLFKLI